ncbi:MAG TPA: tRNA (adenosine(37)-N6)-threonylcarbamoyltransferase complex transferase subunit TsaD, partial [bacterium]|nr:tRNA (adenosine(37)-N6)-threonylcarbamoyltransferase complex transferase subunit TsaD [bacterium]
MKTLGIETSCDDTSIACLDGDQVTVCLNASQEAFHQKYGGVVPEVAARAHLEAINPLLQETLESAGWDLGEVELIAVTQGPGLLGSLLIGVTLAKSIALITGKPIVGVNHLLAHTVAAQLATPDEPLPYPNLTLIASGGHTELVLCPERGAYELLGSTVDDAAGEVLDKVGRELGLGFPAGAAIDRLAAMGHSDAYGLPRPLMHSNDLNFS